MKKFFYILIVTSSASAASPAFAQTQPLDPVVFVANFYRFGLIIAGTLAFAVIVWAGIKYTLSAGNPSAQGDAKSWIWSALMGLLLLAGAYLVLSTISPNLVNLHIGQLKKLNTSTTTPQPPPPTTPSPSPSPVPFCDPATEICF